MEEEKREKGYYVLYKEGEDGEVKESFSLRIAAVVNLTNLVKKRKSSVVVVVSINEKRAQKVKGDSFSPFSGWLNKKIPGWTEGKII
ncbi:MAG: hypothetical protein A2390_02920 [Candidatus Liptonbacteria bacterium RIFOXYB1_FULL_36_10]|uniref:Uncharacterized protein n=2 Tax=Candidatus Liptoniibacteriota TaxID=1817909 RepID=A0A1G2CM23_9BACT|nr:MAG: hypothetical protein A2390_02920 [Candidatus Liptonbacteria bacterium RIFOXYB1_FULL_36_10]OGZ04619.1 MAG: hypothetical protein A2604_00365 [Candidatus Liptonbacteria bacterium RIFOXYD1_FULL_36_11]